MFSEGAIQSLLFGLLSAVSLPLGALTLMLWKPRDRVVAALMAFGGGALLAALTIDLVGNALSHGHFHPLAAGCIVGGLFFVLLDFAVNSKGGFLRKRSTTETWFKRKKTKEFKTLLAQLSKMALFRKLPPEELSHLIPIIVPTRHAAGTVLMRQDDPGESLFLLHRGELDVTDTRHSAHLERLTPGSVAGEMALITGERRTATVSAVTDVEGWDIGRADFLSAVNRSPALAKVFHGMAEKRFELLKNAHAIDETHADEWKAKAAASLENMIAGPTDEELRTAGAEHPGAPLAIWLGILLDGIPESLVIGASTIHASISFSLLAGLFLSNYPEALSSSAGMRRQGMHFLKIVCMWASLMLITGFGAWMGHLFFQQAPGWLFAMIEGSAAGAMLVMISQTMLPEAYHKGGWIIGLSTLAGFLAAIFFKTLE